MGIDEPGHGPLAEPDVAKAIIVPVNIPGIVDSKKLTKEGMRKELLEKIVSYREFSGLWLWKMRQELIKYIFCRQLCKTCGGSDRHYRIEKIVSKLLAPPFQYVRSTWSSLPPRFVYHQSQKAH